MSGREGGQRKLDRKIVVAINKRHQSEKQKLRNVAKRAAK